MGKGGGSVAVAEKVVTPAVARSIAADTESAQATQAAERSRRRGISQTYNRFAASNEGTSNKLG